VLPPAPAALDPVPVPVLVVAPAPKRAAHQTQPSAPPAVPVEGPVFQPDAGSLFAEANEARVRGDRPDAVRLYRDLLERFPAAPEARLSQATLGRLLLDSGDPAAALVELDSYLQGGELTLREEVLTAKAAALARLGRTPEEASAWDALLDGYPDSIHATRARNRIEEIRGH
jgi:tetratricopeptide (TPR) repeat protein